MTIGEKIKNLRKEQGLTIKELSEKSGVSTVSINSYELNQRTPNLINIHKLAKALNCDFDVLYELR